MRTQFNLWTGLAIWSVGLLLLLFVGVLVGVIAPSM